MDEEELGRKIQAALRHLQVVGGVLVTIAVLLQARAPRAMCNVRGRKGLLSPTGRFHLRMPLPPRACTVGLDCADGKLPARACCGQHPLQSRGGFGKLRRRTRPLDNAKTMRTRIVSRVV